MSCKDPKTGALLHAYELDALTDGDAERFEIHLLGCSHCFEEIEGFRAESRLLRDDVEVRDLARTAARASESPDPIGVRLRRYLWPEVPIPFRPALAWIAVLLLLLPAWQGLMRVGDGEIRPVEAIYLMPDRAGDAEVLHPGDSDHGLVSFLIRGAEPGRVYRVVIESSEGRTVYRDDAFDRFDEIETGRLLLPLAEMPPGEYRLIVTDPRAEPPLDRHEYVFRVEG